MFIIFNTHTERAYGKKPNRKDVYETERAAKGMCTRLNKQWGEPHYRPMPLAEFNARPVKMRLVRNLMTGLMVEEPEDTPFICSVASETYWSS